MEVQNFDDSSDDEIDIIAEYSARVGRRLFRRVLIRTNAFDDQHDAAFRDRFRLSKEVVVCILERIEDRLCYDSRRNNPVSPMNQLLMTLRFYAIGSFQMAVGDLCGVSRATVGRTLHKITLLLGSLINEFIQLPATREEQLQTMKDFYDIAKFPGVIGAIDCTHIAIQAPTSDNAELYRNRKGYFSLNVQAVCNAQARITNVVSRWQGSVHDSTIFGQSIVHARFENGEFGNAYLVGDGGYACRSYMMTPLTSPTSPAEVLYNSSQIKTRNVIERCFGIVKRRFPCLRMGLRVKVHRAMKIVVACMILHNIALRCGDKDPPTDREIINGRYVFEDVPVAHDGTSSRNAATAVRTTLINNYFSQF